MIILGSIVCSGITAVIVTKILATYYFKIVDSYVENMINMTKELIESIQYKHE